MNYLPRGSLTPKQWAWTSAPRPGAIPRPVFGIDIDGTLGYYHPHFLRFAAGWLGRESWPGPKTFRSHPEVEWGHEHYDGSCTLAEYMGVSKATYRRVKLAYRQGGLKRSMPVWPGASELTRTLRARGAEVYICTTRPYLQVAGVEPDTREWLRRNHIQHDGVLAGEHKYRDLAKLVGAQRVVAVLDDLPEMLLQAKGLGMTPVLMSAPHNDWAQWADQGGLWAGNEALRTMLELLEKWEGSQ